MTPSRNHALGLLLFWLATVCGGTSCTDTLIAADLNEDGLVTQTEFRAFLKLEAAKGKHGTSKELKVENEKEVKRLFEMFAGEGKNAIDIKDAEAATDSREKFPMQERAVLELLCERSKTLISKQIAPETKEEGNNPFRGEDVVQTKQDFDLDAFVFNLGGIAVNADIAQAACPEPWGAVVSCIIIECPMFMDVCPEMEVPEGTQGENMIESHNMTQTAEVIPSCEELEDSFCETYAPEGNRDCCLADCSEQIQSLTTCIIMETTGEDRSDCAIPECTTIIEVEDNTSQPTPTPPPGSSRQVINANFIVSNLDDIVQPAQVNNSGLSATWSPFVEELVRDVSSETERLLSGSQQRRRQLRVVYEENSAYIYDIILLNECGEGTHPGLVCHNIYGTYSLLLFEEDRANAREIEQKYGTATVEAINDGKLQDVLNEVDPASPLYIGTVPPEDDTGTAGGSDVGFDFDFGEFDFDFDLFGTKLSPERLQEICPDAFTAVVSCVISFCPAFLDVCPVGLEIANIGTGTEATMVVPECTNFVDRVCDSLAFPDGCCLSECKYEMYTMVLCAVETTTEEDRAECNIADSCVDPTSPLGGGSGSGLGPDEFFTLELGDYLESHYGIFIDGISGPDLCPMQWATTLNCVLRECELPLDVCQESLDLQGMVNNTMIAPSAPATCEEHGSQFCERFDIPQDCCFAGCELAMYHLSTCLGSSLHSESFPNGCEESRPACIGPRDQFDQVADSSSFGGFGDFENPLEGGINISDASAPAAVWVNASFLLSNLEGVTAAKLKEELAIGDDSTLKVLLEAFQSFVQSVVDSLVVSPQERRLGLSPGPQLSGIKSDARLLDSSYNAETATVYDFADAPCDSSTAVSRQAGNRTCIAAFGKYRVDLEPEDEALSVYETFSEATQVSIAEGRLQESLQRTANQTNTPTIFVVEGVSSQVDTSFNPIQPAVATSDAGSPTSQDSGGDDPSSAAPSGTNATPEQNANDATTTPPPTTATPTPAPSNTTETKGESRAFSYLPARSSICFSVLVAWALFSF